MDYYKGNIKFCVNKQDLDEALDPITTGVKKRKNHSSEKRIYGIWANSSESEEESSSSRGNIRKGTKNFSAPLSFVSAESHNYKRKRSETKNINRIQSNSHTSSNVGRKKDIGGWEKHTKGFGSKMLEMMGYREGQGLGPQGTGIVEPIKVQMNQGRVCLDSKVIISIDRSEPENDFKEEVKKTVKFDRWKKKGGSVTESGSRFKSVSEIMELAIINPRHLNKPKVNSFIDTDRVGLKTKVINMTGPEYQEFDSLEEYVQKSGASRGSGRGEVDFFPELVQNIDLLVDNTEINLVKLNRQMEYDSDMLVQLKYEQKELNDKKSESANKLTRMTKLLLTLDMIEQRRLSGLIDLDMCEQWFRDLLADFSVEYTQMRLCLLAKPIVFPLIQTAMMTWEPLQTPENQNIQNLFRTWRELLEIEPLPLAGFPQGHTVYEHLFVEVWVPKFVSYLSSASLRDPQPLIQLLDIWKNHLTPHIHKHFDKVVIIPALHAELDFWDPLKDTLPLHYWIHPWPLFHAAQSGLDIPCY